VLAGGVRARRAIRAALSGAASTAVAVTSASSAKTVPVLRFRFGRDPKCQ